MVGSYHQDWRCVDCVQRNCAEVRCSCQKATKLAQDSSILRTIVREADQNLGIYADILAQGNIKVGNAVYVSE